MPVPGISPVSLFMPGMAETQVALSNIDRQRALAQALQQQSLEPIQAGASQGPLGAVTAPMSWTQGLAKLAQGYAGGTMQHNLDDKQLALIKGLSGQYSGLFGSNGAASAPTASSPAVQAALSAGGGPTVANAQTLDQTTPAPTRGPLQMPGQSPAQSQLMYGAAPDKYMEALIKEMSGPDVNKITDALGIQRGSAAYKAILQKALTKETHVPLDTLRQNGIALDENGNVKAYNPPPLPGAFAQFQGGMPTGYAQAPQAQGIIAGNAAAQAGGQEFGKAPYTTDVLNTEGAPSLVTGQQKIEAATGRPMPAPGGLQQSMQVPPQVQASRDQTRLQILQDELKANPNDIALKTELANEQEKQNAAPKIGFPLQDQGAGANQRSYGTERGQLEAGQPQAAIQARGAIANIERLKNVAAELENHPGLPGITGKINQYSVLDVAPQTRAARALQVTLTRQAAVNTLDAMRAASKSGGAVGQVTEKEWPILEQQLAALDSAQGTDDYKVALKNLQNQMDGALQRVKAAYQETYKEPLKYQSIPYQQQGRGIVKITSDAEHAKLAPGQQYIDPNGTLRTKR